MRFSFSSIPLLVPVMLVPVMFVCACGPKPESTSTAVPAESKSAAQNLAVAQVELVEQQEAAAKLNDTGITWGGNYPKNINDDCSAKIDLTLLPEGEKIEGDILAQQDCMSGRDKGKSKAGFDYSKVAADGSLLKDDAAQWSCVLDRVMGLVWEVKHPADGQYGNAGLSDGDDVFTWYNSNYAENGGAVGDWNAKVNQCAGYQPNQPMTYCNIDEFVRRVNESRLCGFSDWRVPSRSELESLVHFGTTRPAIDSSVFPNTKNEFYWSRSATAGFPAMAWGVSFQFGYAAPLQRNNGRPVRLVRSWENN